MKAYKIEMLVIDFDQLGERAIIETIETTRYPNHCISPSVRAIECRDIGLWDDNHPLNNKNKADAEYARLFAPAAQPVVLSDDMRDKVRDAIAAALGEAMDCTRVWSAWSYGTMGPDDFSVVANDDDRLEEIVDAALNAILAAKEQA